MNPTRLSIIGLSCASYLGEEIPRESDQQTIGSHFSPPTIHMESTRLDLPYYTIDEQFDEPGRTERILFEVIEKALERSQLPPEALCETGLFIGSSSYDLRQSEIEYKQQLKENRQRAVPMPFTGYNHLGELICEKFKLNAEPFNINSACTSSANALLLAQSMIRQGHYQHAIVVGIELFNETTINGFSGLQLISEARIAPFDKNRDGIILGESCSAVVLSTMDNPDVSLYLRGGASCFDPYSITTSNPDGSAIAETLEGALKQSNTQKSEVIAIKTHGTATAMNDLSESRGIKAVFPQETPPVTALKPYVGHTLGACGTLELVLFGQAISQGFVPKTLNYETPDPELAISPLSEDLKAQDGVYLLNYFGFGGSNTVIVLEKV